MCLHTDCNVCFQCERSYVTLYFLAPTKNIKLFVNQIIKKKVDHFKTLWQKISHVGQIKNQLMSTEKMFQPASSMTAGGRHALSDITAVLCYL